MKEIRRDRTARIRRDLTAWYRIHGRELPWRKTRDSYRIWVSEIMLQQTQVDTVIAYYRRFLAAFPTVTVLAEAPLESVLKLWEGLGYYARARNLHRGAKVVVSQYQGKLPSTLEGLMSIPGIGRSTAGAILSLAFDEPSPILDGNVKRVLSRLFAVKGELEKGGVQKRLWDISHRLTPKCDVHTYTQAIMDLGATVCTPRSPQCEICPLAKSCAALKQGLQQRLPERRSRKAVPHHDMALAIVRKRGRCLIYQRPDQGLLGGLWDFPSFKMTGDGRLEEAISAGMKHDFGLAVTVGENTGKVSHAYTHFKITLHVMECRCRDDAQAVAAAVPVKWVYPKQLTRYPFPTAARKVFALLDKIGSGK